MLALMTLTVVLGAGPDTGLTTSEAARVECPQSAIRLGMSKEMVRHLLPVQKERWFFTQFHGKDAILFEASRTFVSFCGGRVTSVHEWPFPK
jgi:hypothetical protein